MKRQLLSAVLGTATLGTSCAAAYVQQAPKTLACSVVEIGQRADNGVIAAHGAANLAGFRLMQAWRTGNEEQSTEAEREAKQITARLSAWPDYADALQESIAKMHRATSKMSDAKFYEHAEAGRTNIYTVTYSALLDMAKKRKHLVPDEIWGVY